MILYLFKSTLCLAIFLLVYLLLLEKEKMHRFNRWYLLGSIICSFVVPLISFTTELQSLPVLEEIQVRYVEFFNAGDLKTVPSSIATQAKSIDWQNILLISYCIISIGLLIRFSRNIYLLLSRIGKNKVVRYGSAKLVLLKENVVSHTFLDHIFISETDYTEQNLEQEILIHELTHVRQKHSLDILFIEFLQAICWFNPLFIFYKKAIQLNHEFLADDAVIKSSTNIPAYQYLLLEKISLGNNASLSSPFNFSVTKKRLVMMTRRINSTRTFLKKISLLPIIICVVCVFSSKVIIAKQTQVPTEIKSTKQKESKYPPNPFIKNTPFTKEGVSQSSFDEYVSFQNKYTYTGDGGRRLIDNKKMPTEERYKMEEVFKKMSREQQSKVMLIFFPPLGPTKAEPPTVEQLEKWKNGNLYGVWIGDKKINNDELNNYKASDFAYYNASKLMPNARKNVKYLVQIDLMKHAEFNAMNNARRKEKHFLMALVYKSKNEKEKK